VFDPTLVAVIGVLEEIKKQTNVAGWIRAGGLWAGHDPPSRPSEFVHTAGGYDSLMAAS
jgi:hypothetical protein